MKISPEQRRKAVLYASQLNAVFGESEEGGIILMAAVYNLLANWEIVKFMGKQEGLSIDDEELIRLIRHELVGMNNAGESLNEEYENGGEDAMRESAKEFNEFAEKELGRLKKTKLN